MAGVRLISQSVITFPVLVREDTLCRASLTERERQWLAENRSEQARHWNLLTDWTPDALRHVA